MFLPFGSIQPVARQKLLPFITRARVGCLMRCLTSVSDSDSVVPVARQDALSSL